jgi:hypothetical protein
LIFNLVKSALIVISIIIIYTLLMVSIEQKNFEVAVLRMVGLKKAGIINLVIFQAFLYVIPGIALAFVSCTIILSQASDVFEAEYKVKIDKYPSVGSSLQGVFIGSVIPLLSSIVPIRAALERNIVDALDVERSNTSGMAVKILQKNKKDVQGLILFGSVAVTYGLSIYYILPYSLVSFNLSLAMSVFLFILFGMILALANLAINFMVYLNFLVCQVLLILEKTNVKLTVSKNLTAHRNRNQMTSLMFSLTLGFIVFLSMAAKLPFYKEYNDIVKGRGYRGVDFSWSNLPMNELDHLLRKYDYAIEASGAITS